MIALAVILLLSLIYIYTAVSPSDSELFPKCPTLMYLGFECPGCGSQRAIHHILNLEIFEAMKMNALAVFTIPYLLVWAVFKLYFMRIDNPSEAMLKWRKRLFGEIAIKIIFVLVVLFCVVRNFTDMF